MSLSEKEWKQLNKIRTDLDKLWDKKEKELKKAFEKIENDINKKYCGKFIQLANQKDMFFKSINKCKRCHGDGTITTRACAEADREEEKCPDCNGSGTY